MEQATSGDRPQTEASTPSSAKSPQARPTSESKLRSKASSADVGMVPVSSDASDSNTTSSSNRKSQVSQSSEISSEAVSQPPTKVLSPQERKNQKLQQQLEKSITAAIPSGATSTSDNLISRLTPSSNRKALTITLTNGWYQLEPSQQEAIASALWGQKDSLKFQQLALKDSKGKTIARNPVVGDQMVILRR